MNLHFLLVALAGTAMLLCAGDLVRGFEDKAALLALKAAMVDSSGNLVDWSEADDSPCLWTGITCDLHLGHVVSLDLSNKNLSGVVSAAIGRLRELINLTLDVNNFTGRLPDELARLPALRFLNISHNNFSGRFPQDISRLQSLEVLDAYNNNFSGPLPLGLGSLSSLKHLHLGGSYFDGSIPIEYGNASSLTYLALCGNCLVGPIPSELGNLVALEQLYLGYFNVFTGGIPRELGKLVNLEKLDMASCGIDGPIPAELGNLSSLDSLFLQINNLSGNIPPQLGDLANLRSLDLSNNMLVGTIPADFAKLQSLELLSLFLNHLDGTIPSFIADLPNLQALLLWTNNFTGELPSRLGENGNLTELDVSSNLITGPLPSSLCNGGKLEDLVLLDNQLSGPIPAALGHCRSLIKVRLSRNALTGPIPEGMLSLKALEMLELVDNGLTGPIPSLVDAPLLDFLDLSCNKLEGQVPHSIGKLPSLQKLVLHSNRLDGFLPREIGELSQLEHLDLHGNVLSGPIPAQVASCGKLNYIDLSDNRLSGSIPGILGDMQVLGFLNLSRNHLTGSIPREFSELLSLTSVDFSFNSLSGPIPSDGHFGSFNLSSFVGNPGLCGRGLRSCSASDAKAGAAGGEAGCCHGARRRALWLLLPLFFFTAFLLGFLWHLCRKSSAWGNLCGRLHAARTGARPFVLTAYRRLDFGVQDVLDALNEDNIIGRGGSGTVYRAEMPNGEVVAVKKLPKAGVGDFPGSGSTRDHGFSAEIETLGKIRHKNIVKLLGCCSNQETNLLLYEYMPNGSLGEVLHSKKRSVLDWNTRYNIALQAAYGLCYLHHDCSPLIVHRDVKSNNILLDSEYEARVADFGLAKFFNRGGNCNGKSESMSSIAGTYGYIAPEYAYTLKVNEKTDIYSFGVVLLELITGRRPVEQESRGQDGPDLVTWVRKNMEEAKEGVLKVVDESLKSATLPVHEVTLVVGIALHCCTSQPLERPTMRDVVQMLVDVKLRSRSFYKEICKKQEQLKQEQLKQQQQVQLQVLVQQPSPAAEAEEDQHRPLINL